MRWVRRAPKSAPILTVIRPAANLSAKLRKQQGRHPQVKACFCCVTAIPDSLCEGPTKERNPLLSFMQFVFFPVQGVAADVFGDCRMRSVIAYDAVVKPRLPGKFHLQTMCMPGHRRFVGTYNSRYGAGFGRNGCHLPIR